MSDNDSETPKDNSYEVDTSNDTTHVDIQPTTPQADPPPGHYIHEIPTFPIPTYVVNDDPSPDDPHDDIPEDEE